MQYAVDRDALYYPYIHIRDVNWLKATLLSFPQVRRIVPPEFGLNDRPEVQPFRSVKGARGEALLSEEFTAYAAVDVAQQRLRNRLQQASPEILARYTRQQAEVDFPANPNAFQMHEGKMQPLLEFLRERNLAWPARVDGPNPERWFALHPVLGEVIMSVIAISIAREKQLDIVTSSGRIHRALAHLDEEAAIEPLLGGPVVHQPERSETEIVDELCQVVMLTTFDLSQLSAEQIAGLQKDGKDLRKFKDEILKISAHIPDIPDPVEREKRLRDAAKEVGSEWEKYRKSLPRFAADAIVKVSKEKQPEFIAAAFLGMSYPLVLHVAAGLVIAFAGYAGYTVWRDYKERVSGPYRYLSRIAESATLLAPPPVAARSPARWPFRAQGA